MWVWARFHKMVLGYPLNANIQKTRGTTKDRKMLQRIMDNRDMHAPMIYPKEKVTAAAIYVSHPKLRCVNYI